LVVWQKNDQNGLKDKVKNDVKNGYHECSVYYTYCRLFDQAMGMHVYRYIHNAKITCVRIIVPMFSLDVSKVAFWLHYMELYKELNFNVFLTLPPF